MYIHGKGCIIILKLQSYSQTKCIGTLKILYFSSLANLTFYRAQLRLLIQDLAYLFVLANNFYKHSLHFSNLGKPIMSHAYTVTVELTDCGQTHPTSLDLMNVYYSLFINETMKLYFLEV